MRLDVIRDLKRRLSTGIQEFPAEDISERIHEQFRMRPREPVRRILARLVAGMVLSSQQASIRHSIGTTRIPFEYDLLCLGERLASDASVGVLLGKLAGSRPRSVLIPGCYLGAEDVQFWLRRGVQRVEGIDVYSLASRWAVIVPELEREFRARVRFQQASVESIPFEDASFDLISTSAVLEHVRNLDAMVRETARVLRAGGLARHDFGPLYYTWGGDHCISGYGSGAGYDHLLRDEPEYRRLIRDQPFFDQGADPNAPFWALHDQFSFAEPEEYLDVFRSRFDVEHVVAKIGTEALAFREAEPEKWSSLLAAGIPESSLLVKSLAVVLRKRESR